MRRLFPILATVVGLLLMACFYLGLIGRPDALGRAVRVGSAAAAIAVHASAFGFLQVAGRQVAALARRSRLPEWVEAQAEKNRSKAFLYEIPGSAIAAMGAGLVVGEWWQPILSGSSVSFQIGSFVGESMIVANQSRLLMAMLDRVPLGQPDGKA